MTRTSSKLSLNKMKLNLSCNNCMNPKQSDISNPKPRSATNPNPDSEDQDHKTVNTDMVSSCQSNYESPRFGKIGGEGLAVEKESNDPYLDFRNSMLQMIVENEIYSRDELRELLNCFLQLNAPYHHGVIIKAFTDIWNGMFSATKSSASSAASPGVRRVKKVRRRGVTSQ